MSADEVERARTHMLNLLRKGRWQVKFSTKAPIVWQPSNVRDPRPERISEYFTSITCWDYIEQLLADGHEIEVISMNKPPGSKGYVMKVEHESESRSLYIKLQIGRDLVFRRNFHYSDRRDKI